jgi:hypothetical protein
VHRYWVNDGVQGNTSRLNKLLQRNTSDDPRTVAIFQLIEDDQVDGLALRPDKS